MNVYHLPLDLYRRRVRCDYLVVHCTDTTPEHDVTIGEIRRWHIFERGWIDAGYHFHLRRSGVIEIGRPVWAEGAGAKGWNDQAIHIALAGGRKAGTGKGQPDPTPRPEDNFTRPQYATLRSLLITLAELDEGSEVVCGHRDLPDVTKYCPSFDVAAWWAAQH